ncbi:MAG: hypothetical protein ACI97A_000293 [Planctomycetota bacterium]|jgi:hypothetical protein
MKYQALSLLILLLVSCSTDPKGDLRPENQTPQIVGAWRFAPDQEGYNVNPFPETEESIKEDCELERWASRWLSKLIDDTALPILSDASSLVFGQDGAFYPIGVSWKKDKPWFSKYAYWVATPAFGAEHFGIMGIPGEVDQLSPRSQLESQPTDLPMNFTVASLRVEGDRLFWVIPWGWKLTFPDTNLGTRV